MKTILAALLFCTLPLAAQAAEVPRFDSFDYTGNDATARCRRHDPEHRERAGGFVGAMIGMYAHSGAP
ncbi:MAG TPA: hypothetical protein VN935_01925 [Rhizomicrobium sp.]|nr:hypothetical protein [Rhizomicrobium sp.]